MSFGNCFWGVLAVCAMTAGCGGDGCSGVSCASGLGGAGGAPSVELRVDDYITGLERPWDLAWLPNGTVLVTERPGRLNLFVDGVESDPAIVDLPDVVSTGGEGGLMGLEVDPSFDDNGYVYVCMAHRCR